MMDFEVGDILICEGVDGRHEIHEVIETWEQLRKRDVDPYLVTKLCFPKRNIRFDSFRLQDRRILKRIRRSDLE